MICTWSSLRYIRVSPKLKRSPQEKTNPLQPQVYLLELPYPMPLIGLFNFVAGFATEVIAIIPFITFLKDFTFRIECQFHTQVLLLFFQFPAQWRSQPEFRKQQVVEETKILFFSPDNLSRLMIMSPLISGINYPGLPCCHAALPHCYLPCIFWVRPA